MDVQEGLQVIQCQYVLQVQGLGPRVGIPEEGTKFFNIHVLDVRLTFYSHDIHFSSL